MTTSHRFDVTERYVFRVLGAQVIDGDTYRLEIDPGFRLTTVQPVRLDGWDCPEKHPVAIRRPGVESLQAEVDAALKAQRIASFWFHDAFQTRPVWVRTKKDPDSFGRWLGTIWVDDPIGPDFNADLGEELAANQLAVPWPQRWWERYLQNA